MKENNQINDNQSVETYSTTSPLRKKQSSVTPSKPDDEVRNMRGNNENANCGDNDNNNQFVETMGADLSTSPPRKKQCLVTSSSCSKPDNEGLQGSASDLDSKVSTGSASLSTFHDRDELLKELEATKSHLDNLRKQYEELEGKAKSGEKIHVKEVESLRRSQNELKERLQDSLQSKSEVEVGGSLGACSKDVTAQKHGVGETAQQPLPMVRDQMTMTEETDSDSESDNKGLDYYNENRWFTHYEHLDDGRKIFVISLEEKIRTRSECKKYLKKIGCDSKSNFLGGSKGSPHWFYARLTDNEAEELAR